MLPTMLLIVVGRWLHYLFGQHNPLREPEHELEQRVQRLEDREPQEDVQQVDGLAPAARLRLAVVLEVAPQHLRRAERRAVRPVRLHRELIHRSDGACKRHVRQVVPVRIARF